MRLEVLRADLYDSGRDLSVEGCSGPPWPRFGSGLGHGAEHAATSCSAGSTIGGCGRRVSAR